MLYLLVLTDPELSYDNYSEDFYIGLFETEQQANAELPVMKNKYQRAEWTVTRWKLGALEWREGFARMVDGEPVN